MVVTIAGCHRKAPEAPKKPCQTAKECEVAYQETLYAYDNCKWGKCPDRNAVEGAFLRAEAAKNREYEAKRNVERARERKEAAIRKAAEDEQKRLEREQLQREREEREAAEEAERQRIRREAAEAEAAKQAAIERRQADAQAQARRHGFSQIAFLEDGGLVGFLGDAISDGTSMAELRRTVVELGPLDDSFEARTVLSGGTALFIYDGDGPRVFFRAPPGKTVYEETSLTSLDVEAVRVTGVRSYRTVMGATLQAFVIERVW